MGSNERRERERQEMRDKILDAARELFAKEGHEAVTMRKIAQRIEYSPTAIYLHFEDKSELIRALLAADFQALGASFRRIGHIADPVERLRALGRAYFEFGVGHPDHYKLMFSLPKTGQGDPAAVSPDVGGYAFLRATVAEAIAKGRFRPDLDDADLCAQALWASMHGITSLVVARHGSGPIAWRPPAAIVEVLLDTLVGGMATRPARSAEARSYPVRAGKRNERKPPRPAR